MRGATVPQDLPHKGSNPNVIVSIRVVSGSVDGNSKWTRYQNHDLIFCQRNGKPLHFHNVVRRDFHRVLALEGLRGEMREKGVPAEALPKGLPQIRFHDLRHSTASLLLARGVHPKVVQELLGHSSAQITLDTYSHAIPALSEQAVNGLAGILLAQSGHPDS